MVSRKDSDEYYIISLCDEILGAKASRQHTFDFLRGDGKPGKKLPVDAYYPQLHLVVEYRERQHMESVAFFNKSTTVSGVSRDEQRRIYDERRRELLPKHGISLLEISYLELKHGSNKRLARDRQHDLSVLRDKLSPYTTMIDKQLVANEPTSASVRRHEKKLARREEKDDGTQTWVYRLYKKSEGLFIFGIIALTMFLSVYLSYFVFKASPETSIIVVIIAIFVVPFIFYLYTTGIDEEITKKHSRSSKKPNSSTYNNAGPYPVCCPQCGSNNIGPTEENTFICMSCGLQWRQSYI